MQLIPSSVVPDYTNEQLNTVMFCVFMPAYLILSINANYTSVSSRVVPLKLEKKIAVLNSVSIVIM